MESDTGFLVPKNHVTQKSALWVPYGVLPIPLFVPKSTDGKHDNDSICNYAHPAPKSWAGGSCGRPGARCWSVSARWSETKRSAGLPMHCVVGETTQQHVAVQTHNESLFVLDVLGVSHAHKKHPSQIHIPMCGNLDELGWWRGSQSISHIH